MLPEAFLERMRGLLGEEYAAFLESYERKHARGLRLNPGKIGMDGRSAAERYGFRADSRSPVERDSGVAIRDVEFAHLSAVPWAEDGYYYEALDQPGKHPFHEAGVYYIQEPSAMAPVELLEAQPGERVLDLCAAPGGKSVQIAGKLGGSGILVCNEIHPARAKILSENIERMGIGNACVLNETPERLAEAFPGYFDRVLVDAPCSGEGMFRRSEAAREEWSPENVRLCAGRQDRILDCAARMLRPGGRLVYSTCTFAPEEDEGSVSRFLRRHGEFRILPVEKEGLGLDGCDGRPDVLDEADFVIGMEDSASGPADVVPGLEGALRLWPHRIRGEGHFAAVLEKDGILPEKCLNIDFENTAKRTAKGTARDGMKSREGGLPELFLRFCAENLRLPKAGSAVGAKAAPETGSRQGRTAGAEAPWNEEALAGLGRAVGLGGGLRFLEFGDNLYLVPADMPSLKGLKTLRPGLHLGEGKKNRFEPSHALALALRPAYASHVWSLDADSSVIDGYLSGQTFPAEGEKGWYLICVEGFGTGWGKLAGGVMKNHYPRGLRR